MRSFFNVYVFVPGRPLSFLSWYLEQMGAAVGEKPTGDDVIFRSTLFLDSYVFCHVIGLQPLFVRLGESPKEILHHFSVCRG